MADSQTLNTYITEVLGMDDDGYVRVEDIYRYRQKGVDEEHKVYGYHLATGYLPTYLDEFIVSGFAKEEEFF